MKQALWAVYESPTFKSFLLSSRVFLVSESLAESFSDGGGVFSSVSSLMAIMSSIMGAVSRMTCSDCVSSFSVLLFDSKGVDQILTLKNKNLISLV